MAAARIASPAVIPLSCAPSPVRYAVVWFKYRTGGEKLSTSLNEANIFAPSRALLRTAEQ